jgi:hypothetical protein
MFGFERGTLCISREKLPKDGNVLCHLGFKSKVLPWPLTDLRPFFGNFSWDIYRVSPSPNTKVDI